MVVAKGDSHLAGDCHLSLRHTLALHKSKSAAKTQSEVDIYARQIRAVDESIDSLVYELYGLSADEVKIVEG